MAAIIPVFKKYKSEEKMTFQELIGLKVLVIDDEFGVRENIQAYLSTYEMQVFDSDCGDDIISKLNSTNPDVLLIDYNLKKANGTDVVFQVRSCPKFNDIPIIMLTGYAGQEQEILAFETGIDELLEKPFFTYELMVRIKALIKRQKKQLGLKIIHNDIEVCLQTFQSFYKKKNLKLSKTESIILSILLKNVNSLTTKEIIINQFNKKMRVRTLDVHMVNIRKAFKEINIQPIESIKYLGYSLKI